MFKKRSVNKNCDFKLRIDTTTFRQFLLEIRDGGFEPEIY